MNGLSLFLIFLLGGVVACCIAKSIVLPFKFLKRKVFIFIYDFINIFFLCAVFQIMVTTLNFGIFRVYFTVSFIIGVTVSNKFIVKPLEKLLSFMYNKIKKGVKNKQCKKVRN